MSEFVRCAGCGLFVSTRRSAVCPRCARPVPGSTASAAPAAPAPPAAARPAAPATTAPARTAAPPAPAKPRLTFLGAAASAGGAAIGIGASKAFGAALLFPGVFGLAAAGLLVKVGPKRARPFTAALSVLAGHLGWMTAGALLAGAFGSVALDVVLMAAAGAWLLFRPGLAPVLMLAIFEVLVGAVNAWQLASLDAAAQKPLVLHLLLRAAVLAGLALGYVRHRAQARDVARAALAQTFE